MIIYNKKLSVCPITTHIQIKNISKNLSKKIIYEKVITINKFYLELNLDLNLKFVFGFKSS